MSIETETVFEFGGFRLDAKEQVLTRDGEQISVTPKVFETLVFFLRNPGRLIQKGELMEAIWPDRFVEEGNLTFHVGMLRKALGDDSTNPSYIETVPRRGYRFIADVVSPNGNGIVGADPVSEGTTENVGSAPISSQISNETSGVAAEGIVSTNLNVRRSQRSWPIYAAGIVILLCGIAAIYWWQGRPTDYQRFVANGVTPIETLSDSGGTSSPAISSDGKLIIYHSNQGNKSTLWLRQRASGNTIPLLTLTDEVFIGHVFFGGDEFIRFTHQRKGGPLSLSRIPTLGGSQTRILTGLHGGAAFSPDESQFAFVRFDEEGSRVFIANADGSDEREIFFSARPRNIFGLEWSPDGNSIIYCVAPAAFDRSGTGFGIFQLQLGDGSTRALTDFQWSYIENATWLPDQSGLLVTAKEKNGEADQIWLVSHPEGHAARLTNDSRGFTFKGATSDFSKIIASQERLDTRVWIAAKNDPNAASPQGPAEWDVAWTQNNELLLPTRVSAKADLWIADRATGQKRQLTATDAMERAPVASRSGTFIVYVVAHDGRQNIWRMNADGGDQKPLTLGGDGESFPTLSPDDKWVFYTAAKSGTLWKVSVDGGEPVQVCPDRIQRVAISPDGKRLAHFGRNKDNKRKLLVRSISDCAITDEFDVSVVTAFSPKIVWEPDGRSLIYALDDEKFVGNLWRQTLDGQPPQKLSEFTEGQLFDFAISPDGKWIAFVRGEWKFDAVLLQGLN